MHFNSIHCLFMVSVPPELFPWCSILLWWLGSAAALVFLLYNFLLFLFCLLGFDTSILPICKDSLGWMFNRLDTNYDLLLDQSELGSIYLDKNEPCTRAFFNSCDTYKDSLISNNEWCYCFQRQQGKRWDQPAYVNDWPFCWALSFY